MYQDNYTVINTLTDRQSDAIIRQLIEWHTSFMKDNPHVPANFNRNCIAQMISVALSLHLYRVYDELCRWQRRIK